MPGAIIYNGPSALDGAPIFVAAITGSSNRKTGDMLQTYIMRADLDPLLASKLGEDESICGTCPHRGVPTLDEARRQAEGRSCYVQLFQGPLNVWKTFSAGRYPVLTGPADIRAVGAGRFVRLGTYGDPGAVNARVWQHLLRDASGHTGYTHNGADPAQCMVSADSLQQAQAAWSTGHRTFRIVHHVRDVVRTQEVLCPASKEAGYRSTCERCMLCSGSETKAKSVAIVAHGAGRKFV